MKYRKLELLFLALSLAAVLLSIIVSFTQKAQFSEILGQALFVPVLFVALHYGRQAGFLAATTSALFYLAAKAQEFDTLSLSTIDGQLIIGRAALFGLIGIFGSELATRTKYLIARLAGSEQIDGQTNLYTQEYLRKLIARLFGQYHRFARPFSIIFVTLHWAEPVDAPVREKDVSKAAAVIRSNVRLIDEVGYLSDNCFCLVMPETPAAVALLVYQRIEDIYLGQPHRSHSSPRIVCERVLALPENEAEIKAMLPSPDFAKIIA